MWSTIILIATIANIQVTLATFESFVVGGSYAKISDFPHAAFLSINCYPKASICGGSILNQRIVLTAAHCLERCTNRDEIFVSVGAEGRRDGDIYKVSDFAIHEEYNTRIDIKADIALVRVTKPIKFGPKVKRIIIMKKPPHVQMGYVAGWGLTDEQRDTHTRYIKKVKQPIWYRKKCTTVVKQLPLDTICGGDLYAKDYVASTKLPPAFRYNAEGFDSNVVFDVGTVNVTSVFTTVHSIPLHYGRLVNKNVKTDVSFTVPVGDSGSALVIRDTIQVGLVSFKYMTDALVSLTVYVDVGYHYDWIVRASQKLACLRYN